MQIQLSFKRMFLPPGKTLAVPAVAGARVRVVDGMVWATTSGSQDDVWLGEGQEHTIRRPGLTVVESLVGSTVELIPPAATGAPARTANRYEVGVPRGVLNIAAIAMTAITIGLLVVLPATIEAGSPSRAQAASTMGTAQPGGSAVSGSRVAAPGHIVAQASDGAAARPRAQ